jgi:hypothetical protein
MKALVVSVLLFASVVSRGAPDAHAASWVALEKLPDAKPVHVRVRGRNRVYFRITPRSPLTISIDGPVRMRVVTRAELRDSRDSIATYRIHVTENGRTLETLDTESSAASGARLATGPGVLGKSRRMTFDVRAGSHRIQLAVDGTASALVRLQLSRAKIAEEAMISLTPTEAARSVSVIEGEKTVPYYSVLPHRPVRFRVVGPTPLELMTRLDFDPTMRGTQRYRVQVSEAGTVLREMELRTTKATTATYANLPERVPSKFDRIVLQVGEGVHEIAVDLLSPTRGSAQIRARIPQPSVGNEE